MSDGTATTQAAPESSFPLIVANMPITPRYVRLAIGFIVVLFAGMIVIAPFAGLPAGRVDAFLPAIQTVLSVADLLTATLLFAQYAIQPVRALLALGSGYMFSGAFAFVQTLAFPGVYASAGLLGDGTNTAAWLYVCWHAMFSLGVLVYALWKDTERPPTLFGQSPAASIAISVVFVLAVVAAMTIVAAAAVEHLPQFYIASVTAQTALGNQVNMVLFACSAVALAVLFARRRTILDLCLIVTLLAWMPNFLIAALTTTVRFSIGWYVARGYGLIASCILLMVLLAETMILYSRLASTLTLLRRERGNRMLTVDAATAAIAHEINQPLASIILNASTVGTYLKASPPKLDDAATVLHEIESSSMRASGIISSVRALFGNRPARYRPTSVEDVARQVLELLEHDLRINNVKVVTDFGDKLPLVEADPTQLQQVVLNLIRNAIDAMSLAPPHARRLRLATALYRNFGVVLSVADTGPGILPDDQRRVFDPFFTTKHAGMGLGLPICRTIVEQHGGELRLSDSGTRGSIFEIALPAGREPPP
jgi:signal transduction histidine kinase